MSQAIKFRREVSEFIVQFVLDNGELLIRGSQRRQNSDNEMRQEKWAELAREVNSQFDANLDAEKVKQHFNNRRKSVMNRVREETGKRSFSGVEETLEWLRQSHVVSGRADQDIAEFFIRQHLDKRSSSTPTMSTSEEALTIFKGLGINLSDLGVDDDADNTNDVITDDGLLNPLPPRLSHVVVDIAGDSELKRLLSVLIDNGFYAFRHMESMSGLESASQENRPRGSRKRRHDGSTSEQHQCNDDFGIFDWDATSSDFIEELSANRALQITNGKLEGQSSTTRVKEETADELETSEMQRMADEEVPETTDNLLDLLNSLNSTAAKTKPRKKEKDYTAEGQAVVCEACSTAVRINSSGSKWNLFEHVVLKHSKHRPYQCPLCAYVAVRKVRVRQHMQSVHAFDGEPVDVVTPSMREEWERTMSVCFPKHLLVRKD